MCYVVAARLHLTERDQKLVTSFQLKTKSKQVSENVPLPFDFCSLFDENFHVQTKLQIVNHAARPH